MSVANDIEANVYESLLNSYRIPVVKKPKLTGSYLQVFMGGTNLGIDLFVPSKALEQALEIVSNEHIDEQDFPDFDEIPNEFKDEYESKQHFGAWFVFLVFISGMLVIIYYFGMVILRLFKMR